MKKILAALLSLSFMIPLGMAIIPAHAAGESTPDTDVNFAEGIVWNKKVGGPTTVTTEEGVIMSNVQNPWDSAGCDILPALKKALGDGDSVTVKLTFELEAHMKAGKESTPIKVRPLLRGSGSSSASTDDAWNKEYAEELDGDDTLFFRAGGNIMMNFEGGNVQLRHDTPVTYETVMELTRNQIMCPILSEWMLCVDTIEPTAVIDSVEMRGLSVCLWIMPQRLILPCPITSGRWMSERQTIICSSI